jgi:hypothetical protein
MPAAADLYAAMEAQGVPAESYTAVQEQITTVGEEAARVKSAKLLRGFKLAVTAYVLLFVLILFLPVFTSSSGSQASASNFCLVAWNVLNFAFLLALAWVFRPQEDTNTYLQVGADENAMAHLDTHVRAVHPLCHMPCASLCRVPCVLLQAAQLLKCNAVVLASNHACPALHVTSHVGMC